MKKSHCERSEAISFFDGAALGCRVRHGPSEVLGFPASGTVASVGVTLEQ